jgi:hypothetical protein
MPQIIKGFFRILIIISHLQLIAQKKLSPEKLLMQEKLIANVNWV